MKIDIEILKAISEASDGLVEGLPEDTVRFQLETKRPINNSGLRKRIFDNIQLEKFSLTPLHESLPLFHVLQFPGVKRTIAPDRLFSLADTLLMKLDLVSCTPDIGSTIYMEPDARFLHPDAIESVALDAICWSKEKAPHDFHWSVKAVRAPQAWAISSKRGKGVIVAQPDTGIAQHSELDASNLRLDLSADLITGGSLPTDPLDPGTANPGHGTATGSVVVSRDAGKMVGVAPEASLVPIRCTTDVKIFDGTPVAAAILHAVDKNVDVITMSLGGLYSRSIAAAVRQAVDRGVIVMAAAGNCVGFVCYPASDDRVIAVAGVDVNDRPWKGTSAGPSVTISAPAENVYVARRTPNDNGSGTVSGGQGTSFAVATTAGVAALWIARFGRAKIRAEAAKRGISIQELFRSALIGSARRPARWSSWLHGAGIVDAEALLKLSLRAIPMDNTSHIKPEGVPQGPASLVVDQVFDDTQNAENDHIDWRRYGSEATFLAADAWRRRDALRSRMVEHVARPSPSEGLRLSAPSILARCQAIGGRGPRLVAPVGPALPQPAPNLLRQLLHGKSGNESSFREAKASLEGAGMKSLQDDVQKAFDVLINHSPGSLEADALRSEIVDKTEEAVRSLVRGDQLLTRLDKRFVIEALIKLTGRPAFKIDGGAIAKPEQAQSEWKGILMIGETAIQKLSQSVGRIDLEGDHVGTGFVIGPGLVMTNRHVAEAIADVVVGRDGIQKWFLRENVTINFDDRAKDPTKQFKVRSIVSAGPNKIGTRVDFHNLDLAILDIETTNAYDKKLPGRLPLSGDSADAGFRQDLFVMGYPARPGLSSLEDPHGEITEEEIARRLAVLFGLDYGRKYMCPGRLELTPGAALEDPRGWIMTHDTSTLPGCSGAPLCRFTDDLPVLGLHFAGSTLTANYAHALSIVRTAPSPLSTLDLEWV